MKIAAVCGNGLGSSFMIEMNIKDIFKKLNINNIEVIHFDLSSASNDSADYFVVSSDLKNSLKVNPNKLIVLNSIVDKRELEEKLIKLIESW